MIYATIITALSASYWVPLAVITMGGDNRIFGRTLAGLAYTGIWLAVGVSALLFIGEVLDRDARRRRARRVAAW